MRVLHIHSGNLYGGIETTLVAQARHRHLCRELEQHFALCFMGRLSQELTAAESPVYMLGGVRVRHPGSIWRARQALSNLLRREYFDVVITHSAWTQAIFGPVVRSAGLPLVFWLHDAATGRHWLEQWARLTSPEMALCNSHFTMATLSNIYPHVRAAVVYNPLLSDEPRYSTAEIAAIRSELNTPEDAVVIIQVSRMEEWKGHSVHLQALSLLKHLPNWVCWQVGGAQRPHEARYLENLKSMATWLGIAERVHFLGQRSDVPRLLAAANIHCQPNSGPEPFGNVFIEALFAGLPVVTTDFGGAKEIIDDSCGILVPLGNVQLLAASLQQLIQDMNLRTILGAAGPQRARALCDVGNQMRKLHDVLTSVVRQKVAA